MTPSDRHGGSDEAVAAPELAKRPRNQAIEALRIPSAFGIIADHAGAPFHKPAYAGMIVFLILTPMLEMRLPF